MGEATATAVRVPDGLRPDTHDLCGLPAWVGRRSPEVGRPWLTGRRTDLHLAPRVVQGGDVAQDRMTLMLLLVDFGGGSLTLHRCPRRVRPCRWCGAPIRVLGQLFDDGRVRVRRVDAEASPSAPLVLGPDGFLMWDATRGRKGTRYPNHRCPPELGLGRPGPEGSAEVQRRPERPARRADDWYQGLNGQGPEMASLGL